MAHITGGGLPGNVPRALPEHLGAASIRRPGRCRRSCGCSGALGAIGDAELRATFNGGLGMVLVVPAEAASRTVELATARGVPAWVVGEVVEAAEIGGRYVEEGITR